MWFAIFKNDDGRLISVGERIPSDDFLTSKNLGKLELGEDFDQTNKIWDATSKQFVTWNPESAPRAINLARFLQLMTASELIMFFNYDDVPGMTAAQKRNLKTFIEYLKVVQTIQVGVPMVDSGLRLLQDAGIVSASRMQTLLAGA